MAHSALREDSPVTASSKVESTAAATTAALTATCHGETPSSPASETTSSLSGTEEPDMTLSEQGEQVLQQLARQVEYYFSTANLSKDTYVATLRSLNEGYVPISIIANFGKVRALVPYDGINAVRKAGSEYSDLLEVVLINTQTGKKVPAHDDNICDRVNTLEAVGPISGEPIPADLLAASGSQPSMSASPSTAPSIQNTVILREVPSDVQDENIRELFSFDNCPSIKDMHLDVANCWFVTLDTSSRDDMVHVMFSLRNKTYASGEPVKARLKSGVVMSGDIPVAPISSPSQMMYTPLPLLPAHSNRYFNGQRKNKKKKNSKNKNNASTNGNNVSKGKNGNNRRNKSSGKQKKLNQERPQQNDQQRHKNANSSNASRNNRTSPETSHSSKSTPQTPNEAPPMLGEEQFPALLTDDTIAEPSNTNGKKIEVEKVPQESPEDMDRKRDHSDAGSTATTSTSSSASKLGGYAAALLKAAPKQEVPRPAKKEEKKAAKKVVKKEATPETKASHVSTEAKVSKTPVVVTPPSWGGGRSFADVLKKEEASVSSEQVA